MKFRYVVCGSDNDYYKVSYYDISQCKDAVYLPQILETDSKLLRFLHDHHFGETLNRYFDLPFKGLWNRLYWKNPYKKDDPVCFILFARHLQYQKYGMIQNLRKRHPGCKIVCFYQDLARMVPDFPPEKANEVCDLVLSFDHQDCQTYNWTYYPLVYSKVDVEDDPAIPESDVYFVGKAKDRLGEILAAYEKLRGEGYICDFHITGVPADQQVYPDEIHYCTYMPYNENLKHIKKTRCMLEIMQQGGHGYTLRYCEAIAAGRRLLTNNPVVKDAPFYRDDLISVFQSADDLDPSFIRNGEKDVDYHHVEQISPIRLLEFVDRYFTEEGA